MRTDPAPVELRRARREDVPAIVRLLAADPLGAAREDEPHAESYGRAFAAVDDDPKARPGALRLGFVASHEGLKLSLEPGDPRPASRLAYDERGRGPAIVLIHGHPFDRRMWRPQLAGLSDRFRVVAPDLPGLGGSPPGGEPLTMRGLADAVGGLIAELELARPLVVGLSLGGLVAMELALARPHELGGVALCATTAQPVTAQEARERRARAAEIEAEGMLALTLEMAGRLFGPAARRDPDLVAFVVGMMLHAPPAGAAAALRARAERPDYASLLPRLAIPSLVIAGDRDPYAPEPVVEQLVGALPSPRVVRLAGAGHLPNLEAPEAFDAALAAFAGEVAR